MKIVICKECLDVIAPTFPESRTCRCGNVKSWYKNDRDIVVRGDGKVIAIDNQDIKKSLQGTGGEQLECWILPDNHDHVIRQTKDYNSFN